MTWHDFTWLDNPVWQCTCDKTEMSQHPRSNFLITNSVLCKDGNGNYEQFVHWGEFCSKCLDAWRHHRADDESGDDAISAAIWEGMFVQNNLSVWEKVCLCGGIWRILLGVVDRHPELWPVLWLLLSLNDHHTGPCGNDQRNLEYYIWPYLTTRGTWWWSNFGQCLELNSAILTWDYVTKHRFCCWNDLW